MTTTIRLNPKDLLSRLANSNSSGCLELDEGLVSWKIYLQQGNLNYVFCSVQLLDQLKYYLHYLGLKEAVTALKQLPVSYLTMQSYLQGKSYNQDLYSEVISWLLTEKHIDLSQSLKLIEHITKDALESCLWLNNRGIYLWHAQEPVPLWIREKLGNSISLSVSKCLNVEQTRLRQWQNCSAELVSVHQRPYFTSDWEQKPLPTSGSLNHKTLKKLTQIVRGRTSIRQLSLFLQKDELHVAQVLSPYIDNKIISLRNARPPFDQLPSIPRPKTIVQHSSQVAPSTRSEKTKVTAIKTWKIVCIDDSPSILKEMKRILNQERFEVTVINDPVQSVSMIFRIKPDLILLDITMPRINGYKLCGLLKGSETCNQTPIIMVTGNTGLIDKARAKLAGATDYLTKPFTQQGLMEIIEKHLK